MKWTGLSILVMLTMACGEQGTTSVEATGKYQRPDMNALCPDWGPEVGQTWPAQIFDGQPDLMAAYSGVWDAVAQAEAEGLLEMYGVEVTGDGDYDAMFLLRTRKRAFALLVLSSYHHLREDPTSIPTLPVPAEEFANLSRRVGAVLPITETYGTNPYVLDGASYLFHVFREGRSAAAFWTNPESEFWRTAESVELFRRTFPVTSILRAIEAAMPLGFWAPEEGDEEPDDRYITLPGF